jgi:hypothetical protein
MGYNAAQLGSPRTIPKRAAITKKPSTKKQETYAAANKELVDRIMEVKLAVRMLNKLAESGSVKFRIKRGRLLVDATITETIT